MSSVGITKDRVERWLGKNGDGGCGCEERKRALNVLGWWAKRVLCGRVDDAARHLDSIMDDEGEGKHDGKDS